MKTLRAMALLLAGMGLAGSASATLIGRGPDMVYDDVLNITWTRNANLPGNTGLTWFQANAWAAGLVVDGLSGWRLPYASVSAGIGPADNTQVQWCARPTENPCPDNEMSYMFYVDLGGGLLSDKTGNQIGAGGQLISSIQNEYWSGTANDAIQPVGPFNVWRVLFDNGGQGGYDALTPNDITRNSILSAWAVRDGDVLGLVQSAPILPTSTSPTGTFAFTDELSGYWYDPNTASGYQYQMTSNSLFTEIGSFPTGFASSFAVSAPGCTIPGTFGAGMSVDFATLCGGGVSSFDITGIDPLVDPSNPAAFPVQLEFNTPTADFNMAPLTSPAAAPEPGTLALVGFGLAGLGFSRRRLD